MIKKTFSANIENLYPILDWVRKELKNIAISSSNIKKLELVIEEVIVNIISHSYKTKESTINIFLDLSNKQFVKIQIQDSGPAFNPILEEISIDPEVSVEEKEIGGLGIFLVRKYTDDLIYERKKSKNILTLIKNLSDH